MNIDTALPGVTIRIRTPDGTLYITIAEQENAPRQVIIHAGKTGASLQAWADAVARLISLALRSGLSIESIIQEVSHITTERSSYSNGVIINSGPEGVAHALLKYISSKRGPPTDDRPASVGG